MEEMDKIKAIEDLFGGELSLAEQNKLRQEIDMNPSLKELFNQEEELVAGIKHWSRKELKQKLREIEARLEPIKTAENETVKKKPTNWRPLLAAASVSILIALYFVFNGLSTSPDKLYEQYYEPYQAYAPVIKRGGKMDTDPMTNAMMAYESKDFKKATAELEDIAPGEERDFYLAHSYMASGEHAKALPLLEQLAETGAEPKSTVNWYLALAYLKSKNIPAATEILNRLAGYDNTYQKRSTELLKDL